MAAALRLRGSGCGGSKPATPEAAAAAGSTSLFTSEGGAPIPLGGNSPTPQASPMAVRPPAASSKGTAGAGADAATTSAAATSADSTGADGQQNFEVARITLKFAARLKARAKKTRQRKRAVFMNLGSLMDINEDEHGADDHRADMDLIASLREMEGDSAADLDDETRALVMQALPSLALLPSALQQLVLRTLGAKRISLPEKRRLINRGEAMATCYVVLKGKLASYSSDIDPSESFPLTEYTTGMAICERALDKTRPSPFLVRCVDGVERDGNVRSVPAAELLAIEGKAYRAIVDHTVAAQRHTNDDAIGSFLGSLPCAAALSATQLEGLGELMTLRNYPSRDAMALALAHGAKQGSVFVLKSGACSIKLQRAKEEEQWRLSSHGALPSLLFVPVSDA